MYLYFLGRAGEKGSAYTLVTEKDKEFAGHLVRNLEGANQDVPQSILDLAMQSAWFRKSRFKGGKGKKVNVGGRGLGYRERPGLGSSDNANSGSGGVADIIKPVRTGPGSDRLSAMKAAFRSQYVNQVRILFYIHTMYSLEVCFLIFLFVPLSLFLYMHYIFTTSCFLAY